MIPSRRLFRERCTFISFIAATLCLAIGIALWGEKNPRTGSEAKWWLLGIAAFLYLIAFWSWPRSHRRRQHRRSPLPRIPPPGA